MKIITRKEAIEQGLKRYFTGRPCKHGHISERSTSSGCIDCHKIKLSSQDRSKYKYPEKKREEYQRNKKRYHEYKMKNSTLTFIRRCIERIGEKRFSRTDYESILGYKNSQLKRHIESQFTEGMSWENRREWHIDHIKPIKAFLDEGITDPAIINALDNLQPLWAKDNLSKGAKYNDKN